MAEVKEGELSELVTDLRNANRGTRRGASVLDQSLRRFGAGRSILVDKDGRIIAGNKTAETAEDIGLTRLLIVETDGQELVVVKRTDLSLEEEEGRLLAYYDNRAGELNLTWDPTVLSADLEAGLDLSPLFTEGELEIALGDVSFELPGFADSAEEGAEEIVSLRVTCPDDQAPELMALLDEWRGRGVRWVRG